MKHCSQCEHATATPYMAKITPGLIYCELIAERLDPYPPEFQKKDERSIIAEAIIDTTKGDKCRLSDECRLRLEAVQEGMK